MASVIDGDLVVSGTLTAGALTAVAGSVTNDSVASNAAIDRSKLASETKSFVIPLTDWRVWDAMQTVLPGTSAADDLALVGGTFGTASPTIQTGDVKASTVTRYARALVALPAEYVSATTVTLRANAGMITTVAGTSATIDAEVYESNKASGISADLCSTSAITINSTSFATKDFTINGASLLPGDILDIRITIAVVDAATVTAVIAAIGSLELLCTIKG